MKVSRPARSTGLAGLGSVLALAFAASGCTPKIGDSCVLSTDCDVSGGRVCDTSQPDGYCTILGCNTDSCPDNAVCVLYQANVPGCAYNDYASPSRTGRSFCEAECSDDSDCRQSEGYVCRDPRSFPWNGQILDDNQNQKVCIVAPGALESAVPDYDAAVCSPYPAADAALLDGGTDAAADGGGVTSADAALDGGDASVDAADAGPVDAASGG